MVVEVEVGEGQSLLQEGVKGEVVLEEEAEAGVEQQVVEQVTNSYKLMFICYSVRFLTHCDLLVPGLLRQVRAHIGQVVQGLGELNIMLGFKLSLYPGFLTLKPSKYYTLPRE